jgi:hypothetical protein
MSKEPLRLPWAIALVLVLLWAGVLAEFALKK